MDVDVATASLEYAGTPKEITSLLATAGMGLRFCQICGALASAIWPWCGIPPGDPMSPSTLGLVLAPWHCLVDTECRGVTSWAYMDDRTLKVAPGSMAQERLSKALLVTSVFDQAVGLQENVSKRQHWEGEEKVEHLGLRLQGHFGNAPAMKKLALPCAGWDGIEETIKRLAMVPEILNFLILCFPVFLFLGYPNTLIS